MASKVPDTRSSPIDGAEAPAKQSAANDEAGRISPDTSLPFKADDRLVNTAGGPTTIADSRSSPIDEVLSPDEAAKAYKLYLAMWPRYMEAFSLSTVPKPTALPSFGDYLASLPRFMPPNSLRDDDPALLSSYPCYNAFVPHIAYALINKKTPTADPMPYETYASLLPAKNTDQTSKMSAAPKVDLTNYKVPALTVKVTGAAGAGAAPQAAAPGSPNTRAAYDTYLSTLPSFNQQAAKTDAKVDYSRPVTYESYLALVPSLKKKVEPAVEQGPAQKPEDAYKTYLSMIPHFAAKATGDAKSGEPLSYEAYAKLMPAFPKTPPSTPVQGFNAAGYVATIPSFKAPTAAAAAADKPTILSSYDAYLRTIPVMSKTAVASEDAEVAAITAPRAQQYAPYLQTIPQLPGLSVSPTPLAAAAQKGAKKSVPSATNSTMIVTGVTADGRALVSGVSATKAKPSNLIVSGVTATGQLLVSAVAKPSDRRLPAERTESSPIDEGDAIARAVADQFNEASRLSPDTSLPFATKSAVTGGAQTVATAATRSSPIDEQLGAGGHETRPTTSSCMIVTGVDRSGKPLVAGICKPSAPRAVAAPAASGTSNARAAYETYLSTLPQFASGEQKAPAKVDYERPVTYESYLALIPQIKPTADSGSGPEYGPQLPSSEAYKSYLSMIPHFAAKATGQASDSDLATPLSYEAYTALMPQYGGARPLTPTPFDAVGYAATVPTFAPKVQQQKPAGQPAIVASYDTYLQTLPTYKSSPADLEIAAINRVASPSASATATSSSPIDVADERAQQYATYLHTIPSLTTVGKAQATAGGAASTANQIVSGVDAKGRPLIAGVVVDKATTASSPIDFNSQSNSSAFNEATRVSPDVEAPFKSIDPIKGTDAVDYARTQSSPVDQSTKQPQQNEKDSGTGPVALAKAVADKVSEKVTEAVHQVTGSSTKSEKKADDKPIITTSNTINSTGPTDLTVSTLPVKKPLNAGKMPDAKQEYEKALEKATVVVDDASKARGQVDVPEAADARASYETYLSTLPSFNKQAENAPENVSYDRPVTYESYLALIPSGKSLSSQKQAADQPSEESYNAYLSMIPHFAAKSAGDNKSNEPLSYDDYTKLIPNFNQAPSASQKPADFDRLGYAATVPTFKPQGADANASPSNIMASYSAYLQTIPVYNKAQPKQDANLSADRAENYAGYVKTIPNISPASSQNQLFNKQQYEDALAEATPVVKDALSDDKRNPVEQAIANATSAAKEKAANTGNVVEKAMQNAGKAAENVSEKTSAAITNAKNVVEKAVKDGIEEVKRREAAVEESPIGQKLTGKAESAKENTEKKVDEAIKQAEKEVVSAKNFVNEAIVNNQRPTSCVLEVHDVVHEPDQQKVAAPKATGAVPVEQVIKYDEHKEAPPVARPHAESKPAEQTISNAKNVIEETIKDGLANAKETVNVVAESVKNQNFVKDFPPTNSSSRITGEPKPDKSRIVESVDLTMERDGSDNKNNTGSRVVESVELTFQKVPQASSKPQSKVIDFPQTESECNAQERLDEAMKSMELKVMSDKVEEEKNKNDVPKFPPVSKEQEAEVERRSQQVVEVQREDTVRSSKTWPRSPTNSSEPPGSSALNVNNNNGGRPRAASESQKDTIQPVEPSTWKRLRSYVRDRCTIL